jgi:hypothetical protein
VAFSSKSYHCSNRPFFFQQHLEITVGTSATKDSVNFVTVAGHELGGEVEHQWLAKVQLIPKRPYAQPSKVSNTGRVVPPGIWRDRLASGE